MGQGVAVCKTGGFAYPGSNPGPATGFHRSKPVTRDCVTGFSLPREQLPGPSAVSRGLRVAGSTHRRASAEIASDAI
jgi:hypothetical protein